MRHALAMLLVSCVALSVRADPLPATGPEVMWLTPSDAAEVDDRSWQSRPVSLDRARKLSSRAWLSVRLLPGQLAWIRLHGDPEASRVRIARMTTHDGGALLTDASTIRRGPGELLFEAPVGPPTLLSLHGPASGAPVEAQVWIGAANRPDYRWERWETVAKRWAAAPVGLPPAPPDEVARDLVDQLASVADALARAAREDGVDRASARQALLTAETLLEACPSREPVFPYFRRIDYTVAIAKQAGLRHVKTDGLDVAELKDGQRVRFRMSGPGTLRVDARAVFPAGARRRFTSFALVLRSGGRVLAAETDAAIARPTLEDSAAPQVSWLRRVIAAAPAGDHEYELEVRGAAAQVSLLQHHRARHIEDVVTGNENLAGLLEIAASERGPGVLRDLLQAEAAYVDLRSDEARVYFERVVARTQDAALRAFALGRLAASAPSVKAATDYANGGLDALEGVRGEGIERLRDLIALALAVRAIGDGDMPAAQAVARRVPSMLVRYPAWMGRFVQGASAEEARLLAGLASAVREHPLDEVLLRAAARVWATGTRWLELPLEPEGRSLVTSSVTLSSAAHTCAEAAEDGGVGLVPISAAGVTLRVASAEAPTPYLRRVHLLTLRTDGSRGLGRIDLELDGVRSSIPALAGPERIALGLDQTEHHLRARYDRGQLLVPCNLLDASAVPASGPVYFERRLVALTGQGAVARATLPGIDAVSYLSVEVHANSGSAPARLLLRSNASAIASLEVHAPRPTDQGLETPLSFVVEVPAGARSLDLVRDDAGSEPLAVRLLLRSSLPRAVRTVSEPRPPAHALDAQEASRLRAATRRVRNAQTPAERALARLERGTLLLRLGSSGSARADLERALPALDEAASQQARALLESLRASGLLAAPAGQHSVVLASGVGLANASAGRDCVERALSSRDAHPEQTATRVGACPGALAAYVAGRLADAASKPSEAGPYYARAFEAGAGGAVAREAALRLADHAPVAAFALAHEAERLGDPDAQRALQHARESIDLRPMRNVDTATTLTLPAAPRVDGSPHAALLDLPWASHEATPLRAARPLVSSLRLAAPLALRIEAFCDHAGATAAEAERCPVTLEVDGTITHAAVPSGEVTALGEPPLSRGEHRISVQLDPGAPDAEVFVRITTSRPAGDETSVPPSDDGRFVVGHTAVATRRALARTDAPVRVPLEGPGTLRVDGLFSASQGPPRSLDISITHADGSVSHQTRPVCNADVTPLASPIAERFDCHDVLFVAVTRTGLSQLVITPNGGTDAALTFAVSEPSPAPAVSAVAPPVTSVLAPQSSVSAAQPIVVDNLQGLSRPLSNGQRMLGSLEVQILEVYGGKAAVDPRVGDRFQEVGVYYRRKLDNLPIWLLGAGYLRVRNGPGSQGGHLMAFTRVPGIQLRWLTDLQVFSQAYDGGREKSVTFENYFERTFQALPRFYMLPRAGFNAIHQTLSSRPALRISDNATLDPSVWNAFDRIHPFSAYGQLLLWWVPTMNLIAYGAARASSSSTVKQLDRYTLKGGLHIVLGTTELNGTYLFAYQFAGDARSSAITRQQLGGEVAHTLWITRGQRLGFRLAANSDLTQGGYLFFGGMFWEGSHGRGLDDYSPRDVNFPQQVSQGRGIPAPEQTLR